MRSDKDTSTSADSAVLLKRGSTAAAWIAFALILAALLTFTGFVTYRLHGRSTSADSSAQLRQEHPLFPPGVSLKPVDKPVVGNLGGLSVTFPSEFAENVEYEGDPGFGDMRQGPRPDRTHESSLISMGFRVRYPEFTAIPYKEREVDRRKYSIYNTPWLSVGLTSGSNFGDGQFLERSVAHINQNNVFKFQKLSEQKYGLDVYTPINVDTSLRNFNSKAGYQNSMSDEDIFVHYDANGKVDTLIRCNNVNHDAAPCRQVFYLDPALRVELRVGYRRGMLPHWQEIQSSVKKLIFSFKVEK